jgi:hypothetical protein
VRDAAAIASKKLISKVLVMKETKSQRSRSKILTLDFLLHGNHRDALGLGYSSCMATKSAVRIP